jgi:hypothetical protein
MPDNSEEAFELLSKDAASIGLSHREILSCFSEWLLVNCWRFDGKDFHIFGNFKAADDQTEIVNDQGRRSFQGRMGDAKRDKTRAAVMGALDSKGFVDLGFQLKVDDGPPRPFRTYAQYKLGEDGSDTLIGVSFECLKPLRQVAISDETGSKAA